MKQLITLQQLQLLANRVLQYCKGIKHTTVTVSDDDDGNVTVTIVEPEVSD